MKLETDRACVFLQKRLTDGYLVVLIGIIFMARGWSGNNFVTTMLPTPAAPSQMKHPLPLLFLDVGVNSKILMLITVTDARGGTGRDGTYFSCWRETNK